MHVVAILTALSLIFLPYIVVSEHTNNWAVLVCASRYWFNYRHIANVLGMYRVVKRLGIPDSQIIVMIADDIACNLRNAIPASVFGNADRLLNLYGDNIEVDYRGEQVTVESFLRVLTGRVGKDVPPSKQLLTNEHSNVFIYMTGHGGNEFLKFHDQEEISAYEIADAIEQMHQQKRYNEIFFMIDTCQANTMYSKIYTPNVLAVGSSKLDESSYSHHSDYHLGVAVIDRFTYVNLMFLEEHVTPSSNLTLKHLFDSYDLDIIESTPGIRTDLFKRDLNDVLITDFFGNSRAVLSLKHDSISQQMDWNASQILNTIKTSTADDASNIINQKNSLYNNNDDEGDYNSKFQTKKETMNIVSPIRLNKLN